MKFTKKLLSFLLTGCLSLSLFACGGDNTWAMKRGDTTMPIGVYIYYLYQSFHQAAALVDQNTEVLSATIEGQPAETYIRTKADSYSKNFYFLDQRLSELGITLTEEELAAAQQVTDSQWATLKESLEKSGVSKESFHQAYSLYNLKYRKVFMAEYGTGGAKEVSTEDITVYYRDGSYAYTFLFAPLYQTAEATAGEPLSEEQKTDLEGLFNEYKARIERGEITLAQAGDEFAALVGLDQPSVNTLVNSKEYLFYPEGFVDALSTMPDDSLTLLESENNLVLLQKRSMDEATTALADSPSQMENVLLTMKGPDFTAQLAKDAAEKVTDLTLNTAAMNGVKIGSIVEQSMLLGTKAAEE